MVARVSRLKCTSLLLARLGTDVSSSLMRYTLLRYDMQVITRDGLPVYVSLVQPMRLKLTRGRLTVFMRLHPISLLLFGSLVRKVFRALLEKGLWRLLCSLLEKVVTPGT